MTSREIKDLTPAMQVLWNKFHDRCRRDESLRRQGLVPIIMCTKLDKDEVNRRNGGKTRLLTGEAFTIFLTQWGVPTYDDENWREVIKNAEAVGLKHEKGEFHGC